MHCRIKSGNDVEGPNDGDGFRNATPGSAESSVCGSLASRFQIKSILNLTAHHFPNILLKVVLNISST
jgi:hypothetical protein